MINVSQFINALKISWIRRSIIETKDCFIIHNTMYPFHDKCLMYGSDFIKVNMERISNPFWYDTYKALYNLAFTYKPSYWKDFLCSPLWCYHNIQVGRKSCFIRNWFQAGVMSINDIMDRNGNFYTLEAFRELNDHLFGKELFILFAASAFRKLSSIYVFSYFPFGFEGRIWDLIVSVPDYCLSFYFSEINTLLIQIF